MKAIIMAAGVGSRLKELSGNRPKCLIEADGTTLVRRSVELLAKRGIRDISVITGYRSDLVHRELGERVKYFHNPFFRVTNSIASLWLARNELCDDVILMNADLYYEDAVLDVAIRESGPAVMLSDCTRIEDADFRFGVRENCILLTGNQLSNAETDCEYVGIVRIDKGFADRFKQRLETMIESGDLRNWWEGVLYAFIEDGTDIFHKDVEGAFWTEIDHAGDYDRLTQWLERRPSSVAETQPFSRGPIAEPASFRDASQPVRVRRGRSVGGRPPRAEREMSSRVRIAAGGDADVNLPILPPQTNNDS